MAARRTPGDEPSETERLLAEVDGLIEERPRRSLQPHGAAGPQRGRIVSQLRAATMVGAAAGVSVWVLFAVLPFLRATSGGTGAFLAAFAATVVFRRRR
jgi:hypothetical protein